MEDLTPRQREILDLIRKFTERSGFPPTRADICAAMGFASPNAAETHLRALESKGAIEILAGASRGIRAHRGRRRHAADRARGRGQPDARRRKRRGALPSTRRCSSRAPTTCCSVRGMSMRDAGILDGDLLAVHKTRESSPARSWSRGCATRSR